MDPTFEIIKEAIALMKADSAVTSFVGERIYDRVPEKQDGTPNVKSPYISLGATTFLSEDFDCIDAGIINLQWNCWSWGDGEEYSSALVRKLAFAVRKCLHKKEINLTDNGFVSIDHQLTAYNRARDGVTHQASLTFEVLVDVI